MKNTCLLILLLNVSGIFAQSVLKYQFRANVVPLKKFAYAGAWRVGMETTDNKYNIGLDLMSYWVSERFSVLYSRDSVIRRGTTNVGIVSRGLAFNISRAYPFKINNNRWIFGAQLFSGFSRQTTSINREIFDTTYNRFSGPRWVSLEPNSMAGYKLHGPKLNLAFALFARLELEVSKRFIFTPEFLMPFNINNYIGGATVLDMRPGFNFCLGYRFGKNDKA